MIIRFILISHVPQIVLCIIEITIKKKTNNSALIKVFLILMLNVYE
jgi:hypothetical protein